VAALTSVAEEHDAESLRLAEAEKKRQQEAAGALAEETGLAEERLRQIEAERLRVEAEQKRVQEEAVARSLAEPLLREMEAESQRQREAEKRRQEERRLEEERQRQRRQEEEQARVREACARGHQRAGFFNPQDPGYTGYCGRPGCNYQFPRKVHRGGGTWY
jgi:colicin import membrane protein